MSNRVGVKASHSRDEPPPLQESARVIDPMRGKLQMRRTRVLRDGANKGIKPGIARSGRHFFHHSTTVVRACAVVALDELKGEPDRVRFAPRREGTGDFGSEITDRERDVRHENIVRGGWYFSPTSSDQATLTAKPGGGRARYPKLILKLLLNSRRIGGRGDIRWTGHPTGRACKDPGPLHGHSPPFSQGGDTGSNPVGSAKNWESGNPFRRGHIVKAKVTGGFIIAVKNLWGKV